MFDFWAREDEGSSGHDRGWLGDLFVGPAERHVAQHPTDVVRDEPALALPHFSSQMMSGVSLQSRSFVGHSGLKVRMLSPLV